jgi:hypothetical protein
MAIGYSAEVLLKSAWTPPIGTIADAMSARFGEVLPIRAGRCCACASSLALEVDGADVVIETIAEPRPHLPDPYGLEPLRQAGTAAASDEHAARLSLDCSGPGTGAVWAKAYATVVTLVAGALACLGPGSAVFYPASGATLRPLDALRAGRMALQGVSPIEAWVSFYPFAPTNPTGQGTHGALTRGLAPLIGREIEIAPTPAGPLPAVERARGAAWRALDGGVALADGLTLEQPESGRLLHVRAVAEWARRGVPAFVLVAPESPVDPETLALRPPRPPGPGAGLPDPRRIEELLPRVDGLAARLGPARAALARLGPARTALSGLVPARAALGRLGRRCRPSQDRTEDA